MKLSSVWSWFNDVQKKKKKEKGKRHCVATSVYLRYISIKSFIVWAG